MLKAACQVCLQIGRKRHLPAIYYFLQRNVESEKAAIFLLTMNVKPFTYGWLDHLTSFRQNQRLYLLLEY